MKNFSSFIVELSKEFNVINIPNRRTVIVNVFSINDVNSSYFNYLKSRYGYSWEAFPSATDRKFDVHFFCDL